VQFSILEGQFYMVKKKLNIFGCNMFSSHDFETLIPFGAYNSSCSIIQLFHKKMAATLVDKEKIYIGADNSPQIYSQRLWPDILTNLFTERMQAPHQVQWYTTISCTITNVQQSING
jgi:hypothetical protein